MTNRVLVADDDEPIRKLVAKVLQRNGFIVDAAVDGQDAIERLQVDRFDACVLDLMMPRVDGVGVLRFMQEHDPPMLARTIVVTAYPRTAKATDLSAVCEVISKPFEVDTLVNAVRSCVEKGRAASDAR
ncbi:MAG TPA: response regulator [Thermoanaerobaculia bacterium]|jgi:DNA-binding NtrC family response regulator